MFTIETEFDKSVVTVLDDEGLLEDVILEVLEDGSVDLLQYDNNFEAYALIHMTAHQWLDLLAAIDNTDGTYRMQP
jgi:hypothetical protein